VLIPAPVIIPPRTFDATQRRLRQNNSKKTPPRVVTGPVLLSGFATCGCCDAGMTTRTGNSGRYRYYTCGNKISKGVDTCEGRSVPMDDLDHLITEYILVELLVPERMRSLREGLLKRQMARDDQRSETLVLMREKLEKAELSLSRSYDAIAQGTIDLADPTLKTRVDAIKAERDLAQAAIARDAAEALPAARITDQRIADFIRIMRTGITTGPINFRRAYLRAIVKKAQLHPDGIRIIGLKSDVERAILQSGTGDVLVRSFVPGWRSAKKSNRPSLCGNPGLCYPSR
jgi:site-specific DNA recombinase